MFFTHIRLVNMDLSIASRTRSLNNEGIHYINEGRYGDALKVLSQGLRQMNRILSTNEVREKASTKVEFTEVPRYFASPVRSFFQLNKEFRSKSHCSDLKSFIFSSPIFLPTEDLSSKAFYQEYYLHLSFILMYNLALTYHLCAIDGEICQRNLESAVALYELAYTIQKTEDLDVSVIQTMAIVNNLGQVHTALGNVDKSQYCYQHLLSTIMHLNESGAASDYAAEESLSLDGFVGNVLSLILTTPAATPAA
jgi:tetratricopeptide (TPR) repeat protein